MQECVTAATRSFFNPVYLDAPEMLAGEHLVIFAYSVGGEKYTGMFSSRDEAQKGDKFPIKYNPHRPEENSSIDSLTTWSVGYTKILAVFLFLFFVGFFAWKLLKH